LSRHLISHLDFPPPLPGRWYSRGVTPVTHATGEFPLALWAFRWARVLR